MDTFQIRMNKGLIKMIDSLVKQGIYTNRADIIRDAVRRFVWEKEVGSITSKKNISGNGKFKNPNTIIYSTSIPLPLL